MHGTWGIGLIVRWHSSSSIIWLFLLIALHLEPFLVIFDFRLLYMGSSLLCFGPRCMTHDKSIMSRNMMNVYGVNGKM
jgi:hypothetical protein